MSETQMLALSLIQTVSSKKSSNVLRTSCKTTFPISIVTHNSILGKELNRIEHILIDIMPILYNELSLKRRSVVLAWSDGIRDFCRRSVFIALLIMKSYHRASRVLLMSGVKHEIDGLLLTLSDMVDKG